MQGIVPHTIRQCHCLGIMLQQKFQDGRIGPCLASKMQGGISPAIFGLNGIRMVPIHFLNGVQGSIVFYQKSERWIFVFQWRTVSEILRCKARMLSQQGQNPLLLISINGIVQRDGERSRRIYIVRECWSRGKINTTSGCLPIYHFCQLLSSLLQFRHVVLQLVLMWFRRFKEPLAFLIPDDRHNEENYGSLLESRV